MIKKMYNLRRLRIKNFSLILLLFSFTMASAQTVKPKKNIVIIMADDFNYWNSTTKYYPEVKTPNLDKLSARGVIFADAQAAAPVCNPSRQALWSGFRPSTTGIQGNAGNWIRATAPFQNIVTMNQYFKQNGYFTYGWGKLYHATFDDIGVENDNNNWDKSSVTKIGGSKGTENKFQSPNSSELSWSVNPDPMTTLNCGDFAVTQEVVEQITKYNTTTNAKKPFFFACGLSKPHLAWDAPKQFHKLFTTAKMVKPRGFMADDLNDTGEAEQNWYTDIIGPNKWEDAIHMYLSLLALTDYNAGLIIDAINSSDYKDNTIIVFMGDHGWHLGEKKRFGKASPWDVANKTTLIIYDPSFKNTTGTPKICKKVVSLQDIYPTLVELSGLPIKTDIEGNSLAALIEDPDKPNWDKPVLVSRQFDRMRTNKYSYVDSKGDGGTTVDANDMLYDIGNDPDEIVNMLHSSYNKMPRAEVLKIRTRLVFQLDSIKNIGLTLKKKLTDGYKFVPKQQLVIPGIIEAEDYDEGGYEQSYFDGDKVNSGGKYRTGDGADIYTTDDPNGIFHLGGLSTGEWYNYTVKDYLPAGYKIDFRVKNTGASPAVFQIFNRDALLGEVTIPAATNSWSTFTKQIQLLNQSSARLQIKVKSGSGVQFNSMQFTMVNLSNPEISANISRKSLVSNVITDGVLYLDLQSTDVITTVSIYDVSGKLVSTKKLAGEQKVAFTPNTTLKSGVYFLRVLDDEVSSVEKFIVK